MLKKYKYIFASIFILIAFAVILHAMGQIWICKCGYVKLWHGVTYSSENSQHISDWYTFSHIIHGFVFYWIYSILRKKFNLPFGLGLLLAIIAEVSWEIFENTDMVINRYREVTISLDYYGDSVINSVFDVLAMVFGFVLAVRLPVWVTIALIIAMEIFVGYSIRDNLTLNIIQLIYPTDWILRWQQSSLPFLQWT
ncbi:hypothetical protein A3H04_02980 [Candidatus Giovannonibacteria bacterium RIFCSPLOWO2_12_FULL_43_11c]|nr:MAG: hypothetical protein A3B97_04305 [Candidatus Giovannonibacteria bacterium RIFCSPHIGHO2_02_FULL_43_32]OGF91941.1 MAG: hypothetical protein A3H04_02980 [Candidatus Giovannonibacteria bacterium RIFCSPLOWO2_12_FULL_43_11c]